MGVEDALFKAGATPGDAVVIGDDASGVLFDWEPTLSAGAELLAGPRGTDLRLDEPPLDEPRPEAPPECLECDGPIRPDVVWFGEALPEGAFDDAESAMASAQLVLVIGTSGLVQPAASLPLTALGLGVPVVEINPEPTGFSAHADHSVQLASGTALPLMLSAARRSPGRA